MFSAISDLFLQILTALAQFSGGNFGVAIILFTLLIRTILLPIIIPSLKSQKKLSSLKPELDKLKKQFGHDKSLHSQKQLDLYKQHQINPAAGCLPQLVQIGLFIIFYRVLYSTLNGNAPSGISLNFLWLSLNQPDKTYILPLFAAISQFILGLMISPGASTKAEHQLAAQTKSKKDDQKADDMSEMATAMQSQMMFVMPFLTFIFATRFPSGLALYWVVSTLFSLVQQYFVSGPGGLISATSRFRQLINQSSKSKS